MDESEISELSRYLVRHHPSQYKTPPGVKELLDALDAMEDREYQAISGMEEAGRRYIAYRKEFDAEIRQDPTIEFEGVEYNYGQLFMQKLFAKIAGGDEQKWQRVIDWWKAQPTKKQKDSTGESV